MINLTAPLTIKVLSYAFINPDKAFYSRQLARMIKADPGNLSRKLTELEQDGILYSHTEGRQRYFSLNQQYPLLAETRKIFEAHFSLETTIRDTLKNLTGLEEAYIFGSYAKGKLSRESDIDLLLIGSHDPLAAKRLLLPIQKKLGREINALDFLPEEITKRRAAKDGLIMEIFSNKNIKVI